MVVTTVLVLPDSLYGVAIGILLDAVLVRLESLRVTLTIRLIPTLSELCLTTGIIAIGLCFPAPVVTAPARITLTFAVLAQAAQVFLLSLPAALLCRLQVEHEDIFDRVELTIVVAVDGDPDPALRLGTNLTLLSILLILRGAGASLLLRPLLLPLRPLLLPFRTTLLAFLTPGAILVLLLLAYFGLRRSALSALSVAFVALPILLQGGRGAR